MSVTVEIPEELREQAEAIARARGKTVEEMMTSLLEEAIDAEVRRKAREIVRRARQQGSTLEGLSREELASRYRQISAHILQDAVEAGTAIEGDFLEEE